MLAKLLNTIGVQRSERLAFTRLYIHSFLNGIFISFFATVAYAEFLNHHETAKLPWAFLLSGICGYLLVTVYSRLQKRISPKRLYFYTLGFLLMLMALLRVMCYFAGPGSGLEKLAPFILFVAFAPAQQLLFLEFGGVSLQVFDLRQGKRFFGLISTGDIIAAMLGFFLIRILLENLPFSAYDLLFIAIIVLVGCMLVLRSVFKAFPDEMSRRPPTKEKKAGGKRLDFSFLKDPYITSIALLSLFSVLTAFFSDYLFLGTLKLDPGHQGETSLAKFISWFFGVVKVVELILSLLSSKILSQFGMKVGITIFPLMMLGIILISAISGQFADDKDVFIFFMFVCISQVIDRAVRKGIDIPAFRTLYQPMDTDEKLQTQTVVDGAINQAGLFVSGLLLLIFSYAVTDPLTRMVVFTAICVPVMLFYFLAAIRMFKLYKEKLKKALDIRNETESKIAPAAPALPILYSMLASDGRGQILAATVLYYVNPEQLELRAETLLNSNHKRVVISTLLTIRPTRANEKYISQIKAVVRRFENSRISQVCHKVLSYFDSLSDADLNENDLQGLCSSEQSKDKIQALEHFSKHPKKLHREHYFSLLQSRDDVVIRSCIHLASNENLNFTFPFLNDLLAQAKFSSEIVSQLILFGDETLPFLKHVLSKHGANDIKFSMIRICEGIGSEAAQTFLFEQFFTNDKVFQSEIGSALNRLNFRVESHDERLLIKELLRDTLRQIIWIDASINDLELLDNIELLRKSMSSDRDFYKELMYKLLCLIEDRTAVKLIEENVRGEEKVFALEIVDNFISQDVKEYFIPIVEDLAFNQLEKKTKEQFQIKAYSARDRLRNIINHNYKEVNLATKSLALEALGNQMVSQPPNEIFSGLFHHDELLKGTAAKILIQKENQKGINYIKEQDLIHPGLIKHLDQQIKVPLLLSEKLNYFQTLPIFKGIGRMYLLKLARQFETIHSKGGRRVSLGDLLGKAFVIYSGSIEFQVNGNLVKLEPGHIYVDELHFRLKYSELIEMNDVVVLTCGYVLFTELIYSSNEMFSQFLSNARIPI